MNCFGLSGWTRFFKWRGQNPCFNPSVISVSYFIGVFAPEGRPLGFLLEAGVVGGDALGMAINEDLFNRNLI
jgi:hypothetical protein